MNFRDAFCPACQQITSGDCGQHVLLPRPEPPLRAEVERIRKLLQDYQSAPDQLTQVALLFSIPRLLDRIDHLEALLRERMTAAVR